MVLLPWINGYRHDFTTDEGFDLVVGVAAGTIDLLDSAAEVSRHLAPPPSAAAPERGVDNVHTFRPVLGHTASELPRIPHVLAGYQCL
jgi:hypothetical protein